MFHEHIKSATTTEHRQAEEHSYGREIMGRTLNPTQYAHLLVANYSYISAWEDQWDKLAFEVPASLQLDSRRKSDLLRSDLEKAGVSPSSVKPAEIALPENYAQFMGRMYVIEGSTMGGAVIEKQLKLNENLNQSGFEFYGGYGPDLMPRWRSFLAELNQITSEADQEECITWAKQSFRDMEACFINAKSGASML